MNLLNRKIDEFCYRHPRFGVPNLMKVIVIGTAIVYFLYLLTGYNYSAISFLTFDLGSLLRGEIWRLITFVFVPTSFQPFFLIISLFFYYFIGTALEREWGTAKFNIYYFGGMALSLAGVILASLFTGQDYVLSSTYYVNMSMFFAFAMLYPDATVLLLIVPVKIKYLAWLDAALFALSIAGSLIRLDIVGALLPVIALLNFLVFFGADLMAWVGRKSGAAAHRTSPKTIRYKKAVREQMKEKGYHHKCAVCGKRADLHHIDAIGHGLSQLGISLLLQMQRLLLLLFRAYQQPRSYRRPALNDAEGRRRIAVPALVLSFS